MVNFQNYEPEENVKICNFTDIVPAAARFIQSKTPRRKEKVWGVLMEKNYEARIFEVLQPDGVGGAMSCLYDYCRSYVRECLLT